MKIKSAINKINFYSNKIQRLEGARKLFLICVYLAVCLEKSMNKLGH